MILTRKPSSEYDRHTVVFNKILVVLSCTVGEGGRRFLMFLYSCPTGSAPEGTVIFTRYFPNRNATLILLNC